MSYVACSIIWLGALCFEPHGAKESRDQGDMACGPNSLAIAAGILGRSVSASDLRPLFTDGLNRPSSLLELKLAAEGLGFTTVAVDATATISRLPKLPIIIATQHPPEEHAGNHFVVLYGNTPDGRILLLNFGRPPGVIAPVDLLKQWDGRALIIARNAADLGSFSEDRLLVALWIHRLSWGIVAGCIVTATIWFRRSRAKPQPRIELCSACEAD